MKMSKKHKLEGEFKGESEPPKQRRRNIFADYATGKADPTQVKPLVPIETSPTKISPQETSSTETSSPSIVGPSTPAMKIAIKKNFLKTANPILDNASLPPFDLSVYLHLFRLSWGYRRNYCRVTLDDLRARCLMSRKGAHTALTSLEKKGYVIKCTTNRKYGNVFIVRLPAGCDLDVSLGDISVRDIFQDDMRPGDVSCLPEKRRMSPGETTLDLKERTKENSQRITPLAPQKGESQLKIETARWRKDGPWWEPWDRISAKLRQTLPQEDFRPLSRVLGAVRGLGRSIHIRADGLTPEVLSEPLKKALAEALTEQGITVLRIAV